MVRILLRFFEETVEQPIVSQIILDLKVPLNILTAYVNSKGGEVLVEVPNEALDKVVAAFRKKGVIVSFPKLIEVDTDKCISCGSCVSLCPVDAITWRKIGRLSLTRRNASAACSACVDACPAKAIKSVKQNNSH
jgi:NAD-dependent dihydropyrimidine dehydrogenase PreA subunit